MEDALQFKTTDPLSSTPLRGLMVGTTLHASDNLTKLKIAPNICNILMYQNYLNLKTTLISLQMKPVLYHNKTTK